VVGPSYWKQARGYLKKKAVAVAAAQLPPPEEIIEPLSLSSEAADPPTFSPSELACLEQSFLNPPAQVEFVDPVQAEKRLRKQRFWMLVRVLMRYLEQKDCDMYIQAKETIQDCIKRNRRREHGYRRSLTQVIAVKLKQVVGDDYWRRAETYLGYILAKEADDVEYAAERRELRRCRRRRKIVKAHLACLREGNQNGVGDDEHIQYDEYAANEIYRDPPALITHDDVAGDLLAHDDQMMDDGLPVLVDPTWNPTRPVDNHDDAESRRGAQQRETWPVIIGRNDVLPPVSSRSSSEKRPLDVESSCRKWELPSASLRRLGAAPSAADAAACGIHHPSGTSASHGIISSTTGMLDNSSRLLSNVSLALEEAAAVNGPDHCGAGPRKRLRLEGSFSTTSSIAARPPILERPENVFLEPPPNRS
jgi:hypothetical protein